MFHVYSKQLLTFISLFLLCHLALANQEQLRDQYHQGGEEVRVEDVVAITHDQLDIQIYFENHGEPELNPKTFLVFYRCDTEQDYNILNRKIKEIDPPVYDDDGQLLKEIAFYHELGTPDVAINDPLIGTGEYLVLPGFRFEDGASSVNQVADLEHYKISEMKKACLEAS